MKAAVMDVDLQVECRIGQKDSYTYTDTHTCIHTHTHAHTHSLTISQAHTHTHTLTHLHGWFEGESLHALYEQQCFAPLLLLKHSLSIVLCRE